jgi:hypothetical protein
MRIRRRDRGAAYVLALVTVLVGTVLALAMLQAGNSYYLGESSRAKKRAATNLAQAGVEYAYWQVHYKGQSLPYSADVTLSTGSFHVEATDDGARDRSVMLITSTGACSGRSYTIKRVTLGLLPYHYAWCENGKITTGQELDCMSQGRAMRANDDIDLSDWRNDINQGVWSTGTITTNGSVWPRYPSGPPIAFPDIDYGYYSSIATTTYGSSTTLNSLSYPSDGVVYVNGNATISLFTGKYRGAVTVVATGSITVTGNLTYYDANSYLALITDHTITVQAGAWSVAATLYAHKPDRNGKIILQGAQAVVGTISADDVTASSSVDFRRDSGLNLDIMRRLRLPGL